MGESARRRTAAVYYVYLPERKNMNPDEISAEGKALLRAAVSEAYGITECPAISKGEHGKPYFPDRPEIHFNISHSGSYVVCAVSDYEIGIDIQEQRITDIQKLERLGRRVFSVDAYREFLADEDKQTAFFREWVLKEAYVKWTGEGLLRDMRELPMDGWHQFIEIDRGYFCAIQSQLPLELTVRAVPAEEL